MTSEIAEIEELIKRLRTASGADPNVDALVERASLERVGNTTPEHATDYSASVDACLALLARHLPGWHWHVGYGVKGIFPYATVSNGGEKQFEASAPTVPLALLIAIMEAVAHK